MTKRELCEAVAACEIGITRRAAGELLDAVFASIARAIRRDGRFSYPGFGTWTIRARKARRGRDPRTGAEMRIGASRTVGFRPAQQLRVGL